MEFENLSEFRTEWTEVEKKCQMWNKILSFEDFVFNKTGFKKNILLKKEIYLINFLENNCTNYEEILWIIHSCRISLICTIT